MSPFPGHDRTPFEIRNPKSEIRKVKVGFGYRPKIRNSKFETRNSKFEIRVFGGVWNRPSLTAPRMVFLSAAAAVGTEPLHTWHPPTDPYGERPGPGSSGRPSSLDRDSGVSGKNGSRPRTVSGAGRGLLAWTKQSKN